MYEFILAQCHDSCSARSFWFVAHSSPRLAKMEGCGKNNVLLELKYRALLVLATLGVNIYNRTPAAWIGNPYLALSFMGTDLVEC